MSGTLNEHGGSPPLGSQGRTPASGRSSNDDCETELVEAHAEIERLQSNLTEAYDRLSLKDLMLREVDHRAKNAFLSADGILAFQSSGADDPRVTGALLAARTRLLALAKAHAVLTQVSQGETLSLDALVREVCERISQGLIDEQGDGSGICLHLDLMPVRCRAEQAMPLALLVSEALTNALKHAFPDHRTGTIRVCLREEGAVVRLSVSDDGVGLPAQMHAGQGARLMKRVARHLGADLALLKPMHGGMEVRICLTVAEPKS